MPAVETVPPERVKTEIFEAGEKPEMTSETFPGTVAGFTTCTTSEVASSESCAEAGKEAEVDTGTPLA